MCGLRQLNITKIEQLGSGSIYCQILDVIYPGKVALNKVNWKAKNDYEFINNFKVLQHSFEKLGIKRHVEVPIAHHVGRKALQGQVPG